MRSYPRRYEQSLSQGISVVATVIIALVFEMLVVSGWTVYIWPQWLLLVICYWTVKAPTMLPLSAVLFLGLILDIIHMNLLGIHAVVLLALVYLIRKFHKRFQLFPVLQQAFFIMMITAIYQASLFAFQYWLHPESSKVLFNPWLELTILSSFIVWSFLQFLLNSLSGRRERR